MPAPYGLRLALVLALSAIMLKAEDRAARKRVAPVYPVIARRVGIQGSVSVAVTIAPDGHVVEVKPVAGNTLLRAAATDAARQWVFVSAATQTIQNVDFVFKE